MKQTCSLTLTALAAVLFTASLAYAQNKPVISVSVAGTSVTISWTAVPGASSYNAQLGTYAGGTNTFAGNVGANLGGTVTLGNNTTYFMRVAPVGAGTPSAATLTRSSNGSTTRSRSRTWQTWSSQPR